MPLTRLALAVAALLLAPAAAHADASWKVDSQYRQQATAPLECSTGLVSDPTTGSGGRDSIIAAGNRAAVYFNAAAPPRVGDTVYVAAEEFAPGGDQCLVHSGGTRVSIEFVPSVGTHIEGSFMCGYGRQDATACPVTVVPSGAGVRLKDARNGGTDWPLADPYPGLPARRPAAHRRAVKGFASTPEVFCDGACAPSARAQFVFRFQAGAGHPFSAPIETTVGVNAVAARRPAAGRPAAARRVAAERRVAAVERPAAERRVATAERPAEAERAAAAERPPAARQPAAERPAAGRRRAASRARRARGAPRPGTRPRRVLAPPRRCSPPRRGSCGAP